MSCSLDTHRKWTWITGVFLLFVIYLAWRVAYRTYTAPVGTPTSLDYATAVFTDVMVVAVLLMGITLFFGANLRKYLKKL